MHEARQVGFLASRLKFFSELYKDKPGKPRKHTSYSNSPKSTRWVFAVASIWCDVITSAVVWANFWDIFPAICRRNLEWPCDKASVTQTRKFQKKKIKQRKTPAYLSLTFVVHSPICVCKVGSEWSFYSNPATLPAFCIPHANESPSTRAEPLATQKAWSFECSYTHKPMQDTIRRRKGVWEGNWHVPSLGLTWPSSWSSTSLNYTADWLWSPITLYFSRARSVPLHCSSQTNEIDSSWRRREHCITWKILCGCSATLLGVPLMRESRSEKLRDRKSYLVNTEKNHDKFES